MMDVAGVDLLCLDAGNTVIFLDHERLATIIRGATGIPVTADVLISKEGEAKRLAETNELFDTEWSQHARKAAIGWGRMVGTIALRAGVPAERIGPLLDAAWLEHEGLNLWSKVPDGLGAALDAMRARGAKVAIVSNSEGMLDRLFAELDVLRHFDLVVDSGKVGFEKPDPRIFQVAFDHFGVKPAQALMLGDIFATDILGARAAGCRYALIDPYKHYEGAHPDVPRVPGVVEVANAIPTARQR